jgi:hypothetical protein
MNFEYLNKYFNENEEPYQESFDKLTTPEELHYIANNHNWDNGITVLEWIVKSKLCSEATALMIFWRAQPYDYTEYNYEAKVIKNGDIKIFYLIKTIMENYKNGFYKKTKIKYDPKEDMPEENTPEIMFEETNGEAPYIYYEEKEVNSWFGEYLENKIEACENSMELYNIVYLIQSSNLKNIYEKILENKYCDKGIALLIYWKLKRIYNFDEDKIVNKIKTGGYEIIKYNPKEDKENKIKRKSKWEIPEIMKMEII